MFSGDARTKDLDRDQCDRDRGGMYRMRDFSAVGGMVDCRYLTVFGAGSTPTKKLCDFVPHFK